MIRSSAVGARRLELARGARRGGDIYALNWCVHHLKGPPIGYSSLVYLKFGWVHVEEPPFCHQERSYMASVTSEENRRFSSTSSILDKVSPKHTNNHR